MPSKSQHIIHRIGGGWATAFGPSAFAPIGQDGVVNVPFLVDAENIVYALDGGAKKHGGTEQINGTVIVSSSTVLKGGFEYVRFGTTGSVSRHRMIYASTLVLRDDADGTFTNLITGLESGKVPHFSQFDDLMIFASDSESDVPQSWDGTVQQALAGTPPNFAFSIPHKNRQWAAGVRSTPSRLHYSANVDPEDWEGSGSGTIDIDPDDGDEIRAIASFKDELWVFKGPNRGSIHRITGSSPTDFARKNFVTGLGAVGQNTLFRFADDLGFMWSDGSVHTLKAVDAFGDFRLAALSTPIDPWIEEHVNKARLKHAWAATSSKKGRVVIALAIDSSTNNNAHMVLDFRFNPPRWSLWNSYESSCVFSVVDAQDNDELAIFSGGNDGRVRRTDIATKAIDSSNAISYKLTFPYLDYGLPYNFKTIGEASLGIRPGGAYNLTLGWTRDDGSQQTQTVVQGGGDVLAVDQIPTPSTGAFTLGTSTLGGARFVDRFMSLETGGEFRTIQYQVQQTTAFQDAEVHSIGATISGGADSTEN